MRIGSQLAGLFACQANNDTRRFEYPWAFTAARLEPGQRVLEIGGSLSGFQFVLDRCGCTVVNVDPGEAAHGVGWPVRPETFERLNRAFGTKVTLKNCFIERADLPDASFDRAISISVLEHIPEPDLEEVLRHVARALMPGGLFVITLDLFLDVAPFAPPVSNRWGRNISARWLVEKSGLRLVQGEPSELYGYDAFDPQAILARRDEFVVGRYPVMVQTIVLQKD